MCCWTFCPDVLNLASHLSSAGVDLSRVNHAMVEEYSDGCLFSEAESLDLQAQWSETVGNDGIDAVRDPRNQRCSSCWNNRTSMRCWMYWVYERVALCVMEKGDVESCSDACLWIEQRVEVEGNCFDEEWTFHVYHIFCQKSPAVQYLVQRG